MTEKACTTCHVTKPLDAFVRSSRNKSGRSAQCRSCNSARGKRYYWANLEKSRERSRRYAANNPERLKELARRHYEKRYRKITPEEWEVRKAATRERSRTARLEYARIKWTTDPEFREKRRQYGQKYRAKNRRMTDIDRRIAAAADLIADLSQFKAGVILTKKSHFRVCPALKAIPGAFAAAQKELKRQTDASRDREARRVAVKAWKQLNRTKLQEQHRRRRANIAAAGKTITLAEWEQLKVDFDFRCAYCRERRTLQRDHLVPISKGGTNEISNIVPSCRGCNGRKASKIGVRLAEKNAIAILAS